MTYKGITINDLHSYDDLGVRTIERTIGFPERQTAFVDDIPFMDGGYDFAVALHRPYWGFREVEYVFCAMGEEQKAQTQQVCVWLANVIDTEIYDDLEEDYHLRGSLSSLEVEEHKSQRFTEITATFQCQPYWVSDELTALTFEEGTHDFYNDGMPTTVTVAPQEAGEEITVQLGATSQLVSGETELTEELGSGSNVFMVEGGGIIASYYKTRL